MASETDAKRPTGGGPTAGSAPAVTTSALRGLTGAEVLERRRRGEGNAAKFETSRSYRRIIFDNSVSPVNITLFGISIALIALGLFGDAVFTGGLVLANVIVGVVQEGRAKRQMDRIALLVRPQATVIRDGREEVVDPADIVLGDYLVSRPGDQIQVDGSVLSEEGFGVDEALLTGESDLVRKHTGDVVYSGSFCMTGTAVYEAEKVGAARLAQQITEQARSFKDVRTPLQREVGVVIWVMALLMALLGVEVINYFRQNYDGLPLEESTRSAAVIVALVPQGLWIMITITYAMAIVRMSRTGALIQRMNSVESISHVDVLCMDKTGTLTTNELSVEGIYPIGIDDQELKRRLGVFTASASFSNRTNAAIHDACGGEPLGPAAEVTFDSSRKWSALAFTDPAMLGLYVLGAPEVLKSKLAPDSGGLDGELARWTQQGLRVLLFASTTEIPPALSDQEPQLPPGLTPIGFIVLKDELRHDASETIAEFARSGIALKILSGDHPETVASLARQVGFDESLGVCSGAELDAMDDAELTRVAEEASIFGRVSPGHKQRLVRALQSRGHYVAMIGDGVNDVPALKTAEVAVAMRSGSQVTRNVSDIVLLNDSFSVLPATFREGRRIRKGMETNIRLFLAHSVSAALIILGATLLLSEVFPLTPRTSGVITIPTIGIPALVLAYWARPELTPNRLVPTALDFVLTAGLTIALVSIAVYAVFASRDDAAEARTALAAVDVLCGLALIPYAHRPTTLFLTLEPLREQPRLVLLVLAMLPLFFAASFIPFLRRIYEITTLSAGDYAIVLGAFCLWLVTLKLIWRLQLGRRATDWLTALAGR